MFWFVVAMLSFLASYVVLRFVLLDRKFDKTLVEYTEEDRKWLEKTGISAGSDTDA